MEHVFQPPGSRLCGQACVAMVAGISLDESIRAFGHKHGTRTRELVNVLRRFGFTVPDRLQRPKRLEAPPSFFIGHMRFGRRGWRRGGHWVVVLDGALYDPWPYNLVPESRAGDLVSWLPIRRPR